MVQISDHIVDLFMTPGPHDPRVFHNNHPFIPFPIFLVACVRGARLAVPAVPACSERAQSQSALSSRAGHLLLPPSSVTSF